MKKVFLVLAILLLAVPAMAAVTISGTVNTTTKTVTLNYSGDLARAYSLDVNVSTGTITDVTPTTVGEGSGYGIFMGTIQIDSSGTVTDDGTPVAPNDAPDAAGTGIGTDKVILEMGSLYETTPPATSGTLCTITVSDNCKMRVALNGLRGGVVLENATAASTNLPIIIDIGGGGCYTGPDQTEWAAVGSPCSWGYPRQCHGDADGLNLGDPKAGYFYVQNADLNILLAGWKKDGSALGDYTPAIDPNGWIAADFDHQELGDPKAGYFRVQNNDLNILLEYWKQPDANVPADCN